MDQIIHRFLSDISTVVTESTSELVILTLILILFVGIVIMGFYVYNRSRTLSKVGRQIPASVVTSYLNSIIKNSNELKASLLLPAGIADVPEVPKIAEKKEENPPIPNLGEPTPKTAADMPNEELGKLMKERDELLLRISDYQRAEEDFANLKKIKEENEELKKRVQQLSNPSIEKEPKTLEPPKSTAGEEKSGDDLLKEFEKMLG